jgi:hypothetical protein
MWLLAVLYITMKIYNSPINYNGCKLILLALFWHPVSITTVWPSMVAVLGRRVTIHFASYSIRLLLCASLCTADLIINSANLLFIFVCGHADYGVVSISSICFGDFW